MSLVPSLEVLSTGVTVDKDGYGISWYKHQQELKLLKASHPGYISEEQLVDDEIHFLELNIFKENESIKEAYEKINLINQGKLNESVEGFVDFIKLAASKIWEWIQKLFLWIVYQIKTIKSRFNLNKIQRERYSILKFGKLNLPYIPSRISNLNTEKGVGDTTFIAYNLIHRDLVDMLNAHMKMFMSIEGRSIGYTSISIGNSPLLTDIPHESIGKFLAWCFQNDASTNKPNWDKFESKFGITIDQFIKTLFANVLTQRYMSIDKTVVEKNQRTQSLTTTNIISRSEHEVEYQDRDGKDRTRFVNDGDTKRVDTQQTVTEISQISNYTGVTFLTGNISDMFMDPAAGWDCGDKYRQVLDPRGGLFIQYENTYIRIVDSLNSTMTKITEALKNNKNNKDLIDLQNAISFLIAVIAEANKVFNIFFDKTCRAADLISEDIDKGLLK